MKTSIYLVRHASIEYIPDDYSRPLSEKGKSDVLRLTKEFRKYKVSRVVSSPYLRAVNTVAAIANERGIVVELIDDFRERKVSDTYIEDFDTFSKRQWENFDYHLENGETLRETQIRGIKALSDILNKYSGEDIVVGLHGTILGVILNYYDSKYDYSFWKTLKMPDIFKLVFNNNKLEEITNI